MDNCNNNNVKKSILIPNPITQVASMPYSLYLSLQGKYFLGSTEELTFGKGEYAWAGLYNPDNSGVNLFIYFWQVTNTSESPIRAQFWFNSTPPGRPTKVTTITPANTALSPLPKPHVKLLQASNVNCEPEGGVKAFTRIVQPGETVSDEEFGKFIFPPSGSFIIFLTNPDESCQLTKATIGFAWWEEEICRQY